MFLKTNKKNHRKKTHKKHHNKAKSNCYVNSLELLLVLLFYTNGTYRSKADAILFKDILKGWASKITVSRVIPFGGKEDLWKSFLQILWLAPWKKTHVQQLALWVSSTNTSPKSSKSSSKVTRASSSPFLSPLNHSCEGVSTSDCSFLFFTGLRNHPKNTIAQACRMIPAVPVRQKHCTTNAGTGLVQADFSILALYRVIRNN